MQRNLFSFPIALILLWAVLPATAQKFQPKTIQFKGAPEYSNQELLAAAGLKAGASLSYSEMQASSQRLLDTRLFEGASFMYNGVDLIFTLTPSAVLYPVRLENLPLTPGKELDAALHEHVPLYHGKVPFDGGLTEQVRRALEEMLAAKGIKATVAATPYTDQKLAEVTAMSYMITAPRVLVGEIRLIGVPAPPDPKVVDALANLTGTAYGVEDSPGLIEARLGDYYREKGYLEAEVHAAAQADPVIAPEAVRVSFQVTATPGIRYKLSGIQLAPGLLLSQAEFDRQAQIPSGVFAVSVYVRDSWSFIESQYHNRGYLEAAAHPTPNFDRTQGTVRFTVTVDPGPVYTMGKFTIQNTADDLRAALLALWKLPEGAVFNEGAMKNFYANLPPNSPLARTVAIAVLKYSMQLNHETHTVDVTLRLERKP